MRQIPVREHALCESEEREPVAGKRRTPAGLRPSATPEATVATSPPPGAIGISAVISAPAPQQRSHQTHVLRRNATHPRSRSRYGRCQSGRVLIGAATRGTRHRVTPTVRYRLSSSRQPAPTTWLLWWPSRSAVDDPPDTSDQIASLRSASASSARTGSAVRVRGRFVAVPRRPSGNGPSFAKSPRAERAPNGVEVAEHRRAGKRLDRLAVAMLVAQHRAGDDAASVLEAVQGGHLGRVCIDGRIAGREQQRYPSRSAPARVPQLARKRRDPAWAAHPFGVMTAACTRGTFAERRAKSRRRSLMPRSQREGSTDS